MSDSPNYSPPPPNAGPPTKSGGNGGMIAVLVAVLAVVGISAVCVIGILALLLLPAINAAREAARRNGSLNNARNITLAVMNYESTNAKFPPQFTVDDQGRPLHSWRTLILPYMEFGGLYESMDLETPWNEGANLIAGDTDIPFYRSPRFDDEMPMTNYVAIAGEGFMFNGDQQQRMQSIQDGMSNTIMLVEIANSDIAWAEPRDLTFDQLKLEADDASPDATNVVRNMAIIGYFDGHVVASMIDDPQEFRKQLTHSGGEPVQTW